MLRLLVNALAALGASPAAGGDPPHLTPLPPRHPGRLDGPEATPGDAAHAGALHSAGAGAGTEPLQRQSDGAARAVASSALGEFGPPIKFPLVPVAAALLPDGKVVTWSSAALNAFGPWFSWLRGGRTQTAVYDPARMHVSAVAEISNTRHDMFCPGISMAISGDVVVTGGQTAPATSVYSVGGREWLRGPPMNIARAYQSSATLSDGKVLVLGGSWNTFGGTTNDKGAEVLDPAAPSTSPAGGWQRLRGIRGAAIETADPEGRYRADNYGWFFAWSGGYVFHAGPSVAMHWLDTAEDGDVAAAGARPGGVDQMNGNAVMFHQGRILAVGGSTAYAVKGAPVFSHAQVIEIGAPNTAPRARAVGHMHKVRTYANAVVLPDGKVVVNGGSQECEEFTDDAAVFQPEIWDPDTEEWTLLDTKHQVPRTYHSIALLLPDATVLTGGGGLCGPCGVNHADAEVFYPPYLFAPDGTRVAASARPTVELSAHRAQHGDDVTVTSSQPMKMVAMVRFGTVTHSTNTDQRRVELCGPRTAACGGAEARVKVPEDPGVAVGGNWMVFAINEAGVPSVAATLHIDLRGPTPA